MKLYLSRAACLLPLVLSGCLLHKHHAQNLPPQNIPPPVDETPAAQTQTAQVKPAAPATPSLDSEPEKTTSTDEQAKPSPKHKKTAPKPAATPVTATPNPAQTTQQASAGVPDEVSAIGQLSTGGPRDSREQTERSLANIEKGLNGIHRRLSSQEQKTSAQIREYIKQARAALASNDVDGAQTLATKAKLLLGELTQ